MKTIIPTLGTGKRRRSVTENPNINKDYWQSSAKENIYAAIRTNPLFWSDEAILQEAKMKFNLYFLPFVLGNGIEPQEADVLEIGCGIGRFGFHIAPLVHLYTGLDFIEEYLSKAKSILHDYKNCRLILNDGATRKDVADETQDLVFSFRVLVHIHESKIIYSYLQETVRCLKRDGIAKLEMRGANGMQGYKLRWVNLDLIIDSIGEKGNYFKKWVKHLLSYFPGDFEIPILGKYKIEGIYGRGIPYYRVIEFVESLGAFAAVSPLQHYNIQKYTSNLSSSYWLYIYKNKNRKVIRV